MSPEYGAVLDTTLRRAQGSEGGSGIGLRPREWKAAQGSEGQVATGAGRNAGRRWTKTRTIRHPIAVPSVFAITSDSVG